MQVKKEHPVLLLDMSNVARRHYHLAHSGLVNGTMYGTLRTVLHLIKIYNPSLVLAIWDGKLSSDAVKKIYPEYKSGRNVPSPKYLEQRKALRKALPYFGVCDICYTRKEADVVIGVYTSLLKSKTPCVIVSEDKDFYQIVKSSVYQHTNKGLLDSNVIFENTGVETKHWLDFRSMVGDTSDTVKGVEGVGPVKAKVILRILKKQGVPLVKQFTPDQMDIINRNRKIMRIPIRYEVGGGKTNLTRIIASIKRTPTFNGDVCKKYISGLSMPSLLTNFLFTNTMLAELSDRRTALGYDHD